MKKLSEQKSVLAIMKALKTLHDQYNCKILNDSYRGSMLINPRFTFKQIAKITGLSIPTHRKWCRILAEKKYIVMRSKRRYFANDPITYECARNDLEPVRLYH